MQLPSTLDLAAAAPLWARMRDAKGQPLALDASDVERLGGVCLQVLLAAKAQCTAGGVSFQVDNPSEAFISAAAVMGFDRALNAGVSA